MNQRKSTHYAIYAKFNLNEIKSVLNKTYVGTVSEYNDIISHFIFQIDISPLTLSTKKLSLYTNNWAYKWSIKQFTSEYKWSKNIEIVTMI